MIVNLRISKEQQRVLLYRYPSVKFFLRKAISNYINSIEDHKIKEKLDEYHTRQALNAGAKRQPGTPFWQNRKHSQATKDKISKSLKERYRGTHHHLLEETKEKIGLVHKGKIISKETRDKMSKSNKGKKRSEEQKQNISLGHKGMKYKHKTKELPEMVF